MGLLSELISKKFDTDHQQAQNKVDAYRTIIASQDATPEAKEYALSQILHTASIKGKEGGAVSQIFGHLLGIRGGAAANPQGPPQGQTQPQPTGEQPIPGGGPMVQQKQPAAPQPQIQAMPQRPAHMFMTPEQLAQKKLALEKPVLDYENAQKTNLENLRSEHQTALKKLEFDQQSKIESSKELSKLQAQQAAAGKLTGKEKQDYDTAKALVAQSGGDPNDPKQVQDKLNGLLADRAKMDHDREAEGILKTQAQIGAALSKLSESRQQAGGGSDADEIAQGIMNGDQPPDLVGMARGGLAAKVRAELERKGFNLAQAQLDWKATQRALATMNSQQQTRIRQALDSLNNMLPSVEQAYDEWTKTKLPGGYKLYNKLALDAAANGSGPSAVAAQNLRTLINDSVAETSYVYMGGNSPTDHAIDLAKSNLQANWNPATFKTAMRTLKNNLQIRQNSMNNVNIAGASSNNPYYSSQQNGAAPKAGSAQPQESKDPLGILK